MSEVLRALVGAQGLPNLVHVLPKFLVVEVANPRVLGAEELGAVGLAAEELLLLLAHDEGGALAAFAHFV